MRKRKDVCFARIRSILEKIILPEVLGEKVKLALRL
jgi:hypothetical protein